MQTTNGQRDFCPDVICLGMLHLPSAKSTERIENFMLTVNEVPANKDGVLGGGWAEPGRRIICKWKGYERHGSRISHHHHISVEHLLKSQTSFPVDSYEGLRCIGRHTASGMSKQVCRIERPAGTGVLNQRDADCRYPTVHRYRTRYFQEKTHANLECKIRTCACYWCDT